MSVLTPLPAEGRGSGHKDLSGTSGLLPEKLKLNCTKNKQA